MEKFFKLKENNTTIQVEILAGITTFMTMAYILIVNPSLLEAAGMDKGGVFTATAISAAIATLAMAFMSNYPFALASGMGLNAYFAFAVAPKYGWQIALLAVFAEGIIFILLSFINVRETIFNSIPASIKYSVTVGIGLFIAFVGLQGSGFVVNSDATLVTLGNPKDIRFILTLIGLMATGFFVAKKIKGALLWGILLTYFLGVICQLAGLYVVNPEIGMYSLIPEKLIQFPPSMGKNNIIVAFQTADFSNFNLIQFCIVIFSFLFVDVFDTIGTLIGVSSKAGYLDKDGKLPKVKQALLADAIGTTFGAAIGTSTVTTYVESAAGVAEGGRTGLTGVVFSALMLVSLLFFPIISVIPAFATAPALIIVGVFMCESITKIDFSDFSEGFPAFMALVMMPLTYSISQGLIFGVISYVVIKLLLGKKKDVNVPLIVIACLFVFALFSGL